MKTTLIVSASLLAVAGCSFAARSPEMYRDETTKALEAKNNDVRACYDGVLKGTPGAAGKVTVNFDVAKDGEQGAGTVVNVRVDKANTTAPDAVSDCVTKTIAGAGPLNPPDARQGQATYVYEFAAPPTAAMGATAPKS
jgi:hypothetical protein